MAEHKYAQVLRWIADGKNIEARVGVGYWSRAKHSDVLNFISKGAAAEPDDFRLAPRTITINGREIEAPIDQIKSGEPCYCTDSTGAMTAIRFDEEDIKHRGALACGRLFSTPESAKDAFDLFTLLLIAGDSK